MNSCLHHRWASGLSPHARGALPPLTRTRATVCMTPPPAAAAPPDDEGDTLFADLFLNTATKKCPFTFGCGPAERTLQLEVSTAACTDHDLTGQTTWPGARLLCAWLADQPDEFFRCPALELGAGTGLGGLYFASRGGDVYLTDYQPVVLDLLTRNAPAAAEAAAQAGASAAGRVSVQTLLWGDAEAHARLLGLTPGGQGFATLLGADVVYPGSQHALPGLISSVGALLAPHGCLYLCYCSRARTTDAALFDGLQQAGFLVTMASEETHEGGVTGAVYCIRRAA